LPGVAAIEQQRAGAAGLQLFDERGQVREAADLAVAPRGLLEVEARIGVGLGGAGAHAGGLQQRISRQVRQASLHRAEAEVDARLAKVDRLQLPMAVGDVQEGDLAEWRDVVQAALRAGRIGFGVAAEGHAGHRGRPQHLHKLAPRKGHAPSCARLRAY
jgi:hypothetical protein